MLLHNVRPYLRLQVDEAVSAITVGLSTGYKPVTVQKMKELAWDVPEFDEQYRRR